MINTTATLLFSHGNLPTFLRRFYDQIHQNHKELINHELRRRTSLIHTQIYTYLFIM